MGNFLAGLAIGYVAGTMLAPTPGDELRAGIVDRISRLLPKSVGPHEAVSSLACTLNYASENELMAVRASEEAWFDRIRHRSLAGPATKFYRARSCRSPRLGA